MELKIIDTIWKIRLLSPEQFLKEHGKKYKDTGAVTDTGRKLIDFRSDEIYEQHARHEVFHAYFDGLLLDAADLDQDKTEDVCAYLMGKYGEEYIANSRKVYAWLLEQKQ